MAHKGTRSTRGRTLLALNHSAGSVRTVNVDDVSNVLEAHYSEMVSPEGLSSIVSLLNDRVYHVDLIPASTRVDPNLLAKISRHASKLSELLTEGGEAKGMVRDLLASIKYEPSEIQGDQRDLITWLVRLKHNDRYFTPVDVNRAYKNTIKRLRDIFASEDLSVAIHDTSSFLCFLSDLEDRYPHLVFPPENGPQGRAKYAQRAVA